MEKLNKTFESIELEAAHESSPIEWWFFNGSFKTERLGTHDFMISFFRHNFAEKDQKPKNGFSLLFSILDPDKNENHTLTQIDPTVLKGMIDLLNRDEKLNLDEEVIKVVLKELKQHGPPKPIIMDETEHNLSDPNFHIFWKNFHLAQDENGFNLEFPLMSKKGTCYLRLVPSTPRYEILKVEDNKVLGTDMTYLCYPKLNITGNFDGESINGTAWMDHQWGDGFWGILNKPNKKFLGWDWFGINFNNGKNLAIILHKEAETNEEIISHAVLFDSNHHRYHTNNVIAQPLEFWESPITHINYPIKWKIDIEEFKISLIYEPTTENQEIHIFGMARAIWEGAGHVNGTMNGENVTGRARGEFYGYGFIFDFQNYLQRLTDKIDKRIGEYFPKKFNEKTVQKFVGKPYWKHEPEAYTEMLSTPIWDLILRKGKRWRPIYGILMGEALGKSSEHFESSACLAELVHSGALIIDDIQDKSLLRRGEKCLHLKYGTDVAINAGNTLYFLPSIDLLKHEYLTEKQKLLIHEIWMKTYLEAHFGQSLDIYWSKKMNLKNLNNWLDGPIESKILQMYDYKTAAGPKGLAEVAAVIAESDDEIKDTVISYSRSFAVAFQIIDDVYNFSRSEQWKKKCGEDLENGKLTYVIVKAIKKLDKPDSKQLKKILSTKKLRNDKSALNIGIDLVRDSGALEECKDEAQRMSLDAWEQFALKIPSCEPKIMLNLLCLKMLNLAYDT